MQPRYGHSEVCAGGGDCIEDGYSREEPAQTPRTTVDKSMRVKPTTFGSTFVVVWALANLVHHANGSRGPLDPISILNVLAALWVLAAPRSGGRLCLLAGS